MIMMLMYVRFHILFCSVRYKAIGKQLANASVSRLHSYRMCTLAMINVCDNLGFGIPLQRSDQNVSQTNIIAIY